MALLVNVIAVMALMCPSVAAADCVDGTGSCALDDLTSLVQMKQNVKFGSDRSASEEAVDPSTRKAFDANKKKVEDQVETAAAHRAAFEKEVEEKRAQSRKETEERIKADRLSMEKSAKIDEDALDNAAKSHREAEKDAADKVNHAKREWEETSIKKHHAEEAAVVGRAAGLNSGAMHAKEKEIEAEEAAAKAAQAKLHAQEKAFEAKRAREKEDAVKRQTEKHVEENREMADTSAEETNAASKKAAENTEEVVHHVKKSEAAMEDEADKRAGRFKKGTADNKRHIDKAEHAEWPRDD